MTVHYLPQYRGFDTGNPALAAALSSLEGYDHDNVAADALP